jgi:hypothetical protein
MVSPSEVLNGEIQGKAQSTQQVKGRIQKRKTHDLQIITFEGDIRSACAGQGHLRSELRASLDAPKCSG